MDRVLDHFCVHVRPMYDWAPTHVHTCNPIRMLENTLMFLSEYRQITKNILVFTPYYGQFASKRLENKHFAGPGFSVWLCSHVPYTAHPVYSYHSYHIRISLVLSIWQFLSLVLLYQWQFLPPWIRSRQGRRSPWAPWCSPWRGSTSSQPSSQPCTRS